MRLSSSSSTTFDALSLGDVMLLFWDQTLAWHRPSDQTMEGLGKTFNESGFSIEKSGNDRR